MDWVWLDIPWTMGVEFYKEIYFPSKVFMLSWIFPIRKWFIVVSFSVFRLKYRIAKVKSNCLNCCIYFYIPNYNIFSIVNGYWWLKPMVYYRFTNDWFGFVWYIISLNHGVLYLTKTSQYFLSFPSLSLRMFNRHSTDIWSVLNKRCY